MRTLAEPNLTALSGQEAKFLAGGEYPIPVASGDGAITVEYKPFGVELNFTPIVVDGDIINLTINAAVSGIDSTTTLQTEGFSINAFKPPRNLDHGRDARRRKLCHRRPFAGRFPRSERSGAVAGRHPDLGALFRSAEYQRNQSELVIIVTPHLVTPTRGEALALPTDRVRLPRKRTVPVRQDRGGLFRRGPAGEVARQDFSGSYGYVME